MSQKLTTLCLFLDNQRETSQDMSAVQTETSAVALIFPTYTELFTYPKVISIMWHRSPIPAVRIICRL